MIRSWRLLLGLFALATGANAAPLKIYNGRLFIDARVNDISTEALLDSGAEATLIDPALAAKAKLSKGTPQVMKGSGGTAKAQIVEGVTLNALGIELQPEAVVVLDLTELSERLLKRPTHLIVGRELFDAARLNIDLANHSIRRAPAGKRPAGVELPLTSHAGIEAIPVTVNGVEAQAEFDLGNGSDVLISRDMVKKLGLEIVGRKKGGGIGGSVNRDLVRLDTLEVAGRRFRNVTAAIDDQPSHNEMNVGTAILRHFRLTTDFKKRAVWLQPIGASR